MWRLTTAEGADAPFSFRILPGTIKTIGRATRADFIVEASLVSRLHCRFTVRPDGALEIQDLDSTNGTFVNGKKVERAELKDGDELGIGRVKLKVTLVQ